MKTTLPPNKIYFTKDEDNKSELVIEPLYPGYGVTIGNALRRVLLSSLPGAAVTAVKIKGVDHEFSTIPAVTEDVVDVLLNLKQLRLRLHAEEPVTLTLKVKGQRQATAADIRADARVEIINSDLVLATLDGKTAELEMDIVVEQGRGYVPVEQRESEKLEIGMIAVDAIFTPVRNVNFEVQNVRVGQITNYDKLTITMETDGTISGREALDIASQILVDHFSLLKTDKIDAATTAREQATLPMPETRSVPAAADLASLDLSNRVLHALAKHGITTRVALEKMTRTDLDSIEGLGEKSISEILKALGRA